jgi:hypothetical protein
MNRQLLFEPTEMALHIVPVYRVQKEIGEDLWGNQWQCTRYPWIE